MFVGATRLGDCALRDPGASLFVAELTCVPVIQLIPVGVTSASIRSDREALRIIEEDHHEKD